MKYHNYTGIYEDTLKNKHKVTIKWSVKNSRYLVFNSKGSVITLLYTDDKVKEHIKNLKSTYKTIWI